MVQTVTLKTQEPTRCGGGRDLDQIRIQVGRDTDRMVTRAADDLDKSLTLIESGTDSIINGAGKTSRTSQGSSSAWV